MLASEPFPSPGRNLLGHSVCHLVLRCWFLFVSKPSSVPVCVCMGRGGLCLLGTISPSLSLDGSFLGSVPRRAFYGTHPFPGVTPSAVAPVTSRLLVCPFPRARERQPPAGSRPLCGCRTPAPGLGSPGSASGGVTEAGCRRTGRLPPAVGGSASPSARWRSAPELRDPANRGDSRRRRRCRRPRGTREPAGWTH